MKVKRESKKRNTHIIPSTIKEARQSTREWQHNRVSKQQCRYTCKPQQHTADSTTTMKFSFSVFFVLEQQTHSQKDKKKTNYTRIYSLFFQLKPMCFFFHFVLHCTIYPPYDFLFSLSLGSVCWLIRFAQRIIGLSHFRTVCVLSFASFYSTQKIANTFNRAYKIRFLLFNQKEKKNFFERIKILQNYLFSFRFYAYRIRIRYKHTKLHFQLKKKTKEREKKRIVALICEQNFQRKEQKKKQFHFIKLYGIQ